MKKLVPQTVLIVEDLPTCREPIAASLRRAGYRVFCADSARQALTMIEDHFPDAILIDLALPDVSGIDLLRTLRDTQEWRDLPAIVFTGSGDVMSLLTGLGVTACLVKSVAGLKEIRAAIAEALAST